MGVRRAKPEESNGSKAEVFIGSLNSQISLYTLFPLMSSIDDEVGGQGASESKIEVYGLPILVILRIVRAEILGGEFRIGPPKGRGDLDLGMDGKLSFLADPIVSYAIESAGLKGDLCTIKQGAVGRIDEVGRIPISGVQLGDLADQNTRHSVPIGSAHHAILRRGFDPLGRHRELAVGQRDEAGGGPRFTGLGIRSEWGGDQFVEEMRLPLHQLRTGRESWV